MERLCLEFINSEFRDFRGRGTRDDLQNPAWRARFLAKWHLTVEQPTDDAVLTELLALRARLIHVVEMLSRQGTIAEEDLAALNGLLRETSFTYQIEQHGQRYRLNNIPARQDWQRVQSEIIADFITMLTSFDLLRLKICQNPHCREIFYDETKSRTRRYCTTDICGSLMKTRRFHARQRARRLGGE
jgi:predicted RNA-binding Zn ribbon-like protein